MSSTEMSPTRASLAAESADRITSNAHMAGDLNKDNLLPIFGQIHIYLYSSRICTKTGWSYFKLHTAFIDESESDSIKNGFSSA